ncbi:hypothetical protein GHT06_005461 [Daphnia sinensis]|uniref:Uncharacterized protein n=1 Tax=Daphnia sinensis TaxID=1820382 RepID=A0AAD5KSZ4_9CRUS|nr:hypothetical protein GHT06_005461 [Daphnia sinensis]
MACKLDSVSLGCLPTFPTSSGRVVVYWTRLRCPGNSTECRWNPIPVTHSKWLCDWEIPAQLP